MRAFNGTAPDDRLLRLIEPLPGTLTFSVRLPFWLGIRLKRFARKVGVGPRYCRLYFVIKLGGDGRVFEPPLPEGHVYEN